MLNNQYCKQPINVSICTSLECKNHCTTVLYRNVLTLQLISKAFDFNNASKNKGCRLISTAMKAFFWVGYFIVLHKTLKNRENIGNEILGSKRLVEV